MHDNLGEKYTLKAENLTVMSIEHAEQRIECIITNNTTLPSQENVPLFHISVTNSEETTEIQTKIKQELEKIWFLSVEYQHEVLKEKFVLSLDGDTQIEIYNFGESLTPEQQTTMAQTIQWYYDSLRDKSAWKVKTIQIRSQNKQNVVSGEFSRGHSFEDRFELFPASFDPGKYRDCIDMTWLEAVLLHEPNHVNFESKALQHTQDWGWKMIDDAMIQLPGGETTTWFHPHPEQCPTEYGSTHPYEDMCETVVIGFSDPTLLTTERKAFFDQNFNSQAKSQKTLERVTHTELPQLKKIAVQVTVQQENLNLFGEFKILPKPEKPRIPLAQYRQRMILS